MVDEEVYQCIAKVSIHIENVCVFVAHRIRNFIIILYERRHSRHFIRFGNFDWTKRIDKIGNAEVVFYSWRFSWLFRENAIANMMVLVWKCRKCRNGGKKGSAWMKEWNAYFCKCSMPSEDKVPNELCNTLLRAIHSCHRCRHCRWRIWNCEI